MFISRTTPLAAVTIAAVVALAGCAPAVQSTPAPTSTLTPVPLPATPTPIPGAQWIDSSASFNVLAEVAVLGTYISTTDSGYSFQGQSKDAFPAGTRVLVVEFRLDGFVPHGQADVTGLNVDASKFDGRAELAVIDTHEGPAFAAAHDVPWMPAGMFDGQPVPWLLTNHQMVYFAAAWYIPAGTTELDIRLGADADTAHPMRLAVPVQSGE